MLCDAEARFVGKKHELKAPILAAFGCEHATVPCRPVHVRNQPLPTHALETTRLLRAWRLHEHELSAVQLKLDKG